MEDLLHFAAVSSERTRLEPPTPLVAKSKSASHKHYPSHLGPGGSATPLGKDNANYTPRKMAPESSKKSRASMPSLLLGGINPPDPISTPTPSTKKRRKSHSHVEGSARKHHHHRDKEHRGNRDRERERDRSRSDAFGNRASSPVGGPSTSPIANYTPLSKLSALAATALALANANPSDTGELMMTEDEVRRADKERRKEEKRRRREARAAEAADGDDGDDGDADGDESRSSKKKRKHHKEKEKEKEKENEPAAVTYSLPPPATPARGTLPATPTPKRRKHKDSNLKPETPYTGPSRSAADVSMAALLASGRKKRPGPAEEDEGTPAGGSARKHHRRESRTGADMAVSALLVTPRRPEAGGEKRHKKDRSHKKEKKDKKDRTVENTMGVHALLATPGAPGAPGAPFTPGMSSVGLPPSTPGLHPDTDADIPDTDGIEPADENRRAEKEKRRAERAARKAEKARRRAEKAERKARKEQERAQAAQPPVPTSIIEPARDRTPEPATTVSKAKPQQNGSKKNGDSSDSDSDSDAGVNPADILRGVRQSRAPPPVAQEPQVDLTDILRGRPRASQPQVQNQTVPAQPPAVLMPAPPVPKPKVARKVSQPLVPATAVSAPNATAAFATTSRTGRKKNAAEGPSQADQDAALRRELADEGVMNEFLASKWIEIKELQRLEAAGVLRYKRGRFSEEERSALREWLDTFRKVNRLTEEELLDIIMAKGKAGERSQYPKFYSDLAGQVPGRPVRYVKEAVKRMYDPRARKGAWTKHEDAELLRAYELHPNEWIKIAAIVDRSESDCRDRWRGELKGQESRVTGAWSTEETDSLIAAVTEANKRLGLPPTAPETPWQVVVDLMGGTRSLTQCRKKWQDTILPDLKAKEARDAGVHITKTSVSRRDLLDRLRALNVTHERDLSWTRVVPPEWDVKPGTLRGVWHRMKHAVTGWNEMPFTELLDKIEESL